MQLSGHILGIDTHVPFFSSGVTAHLMKLLTDSYFPSFVHFNKKKNS